MKVVVHFTELKLISRLRKIGREWQCSTIQFDFSTRTIDMNYIGADGNKHRHT